MARGIQRDRKKERMWRRCMMAQARSGLSVRAWCGRHGLREPSFHWWRRELARRDAENGVVYASSRASRGHPSVMLGEPAFVPVRVKRASSSNQPAEAEDHPTGHPLEIVLAGDRRILLRGRVDRQALSDVLAVLEARAC